MFESFNSILKTIDSFVWGLPLIILIISVGLFLTIRLKGLQITYLDLQMKENLIQKQNKNVKKPVIRFTNHWFLLTSYMLFPVYFLF